MVAQRLGERLLAGGLITEEQLQHALEMQPSSSRPLGRILVELGVVDEDRLDTALSTHLDVPIVDLRREPVDADVAQLVPEEFARRHVLLPIRRDDGHLAVAMADPSNLYVVNDLRSTNGTLVDGRKIAEATELQDKSEFQIGGTSIMLIVTDDA